MLVHGGVDYDGNLLTDLRVFNISTPPLTQNSASGNTPSSRTPCRPSRTMRSAPTSETRSSTTKPETSTSSAKAARKYASPHQTSLLPHEGVYFFGGKDSAGLALGKLWMLKVYQTPLEFVECQTQGKPPKARYGHCLHQVENSQYLVLFGGRNDHFFKIFTFKSTFLEVDILNLETMAWVKLNVGSYKPESRFAFCSTVSGSRLYVFGGLGDNNYIESRMEKLELDSEKVDAIIKVEKKLLAGGKKEPLWVREEDLAKPAQLQDDATTFQLFLRADSPLKGGLLRGASVEEAEEASQVSSPQVVGSAHQTKSYLPVPILPEHQQRYVHGADFPGKSLRLF